MSTIIFAAKSLSDDNAHEQTIIFRQIFAGHVVGVRSRKRKRKMHRMIKRIFECSLRLCFVKQMTLQGRPADSIKQQHGFERGFYNAGKLPLAQGTEAF